MAKPQLFTTAVVSSLVLLSACGGGAPAVDTPEDAAGPTTDGASAGPSDDAARPKDGIVRDADGDGKPDNTASGCEGKNETQCKINSSCAWTDDGKCVEASASPTM